MEKQNRERTHLFPGRLAYVYKEWKEMVAGKSINSSSYIPEIILRSWKRSKECGVDPFLKGVAITLKGPDLGALLKNNETLINLCMPFMEILYSHVKGSGFSVVLFDSNAYVLSMIGDEDILKDHHRGGYVVGSCWSEQSLGANACGTIIYEDKPIQICACEHFCRLAHGYSGSGAPIHDPEGNVIGGINMTGIYEKVTAHTLGAVVAAAQAIDNELRRQKAVEDLKAAYDLQEAVFESSQDAMIAIARDKTVSLVNKRAKRLLNLADEVIGKKFEDIFPEKDNENFVKELLYGPPLQDKEYNVFRGTECHKFTVSSTLVKSSAKNIQGSIVTLSEIKRARKLVTNIIGAQAKFHFDDIVGRDPAFMTTVELGKRAAATSSNVLLLGESGSGKDIFAQAIHRSSDRQSRPYIALNCGAMPRELITSELFGYEDGAFTGSKKGGNPGKFELASGGTVFLDEIGAMPLELQSVLLRVLEERKITRIGGKTNISVDVRIIAATNQNLREEVSKGNFREDLYFRLNVFTIEMVPLRARKQDIPVLIERIIGRLNDSLGTNIRHVDQRVTEYLMNYEWPGNVRELQNVIERMMNLAAGTELTPDIIPPEIFTSRKPQRDNYYGMSLEELERSRIRDMLKSNYTKAEIARQLKIARSTLYLKMNKYGLQKWAQ